MKKLLVATVVIMFTLFTCSKEEIILQSKWKLVEVLADPGDGSGVFVSVQSERTIEFFDNGTFESNGNICSMGTDTDLPIEGVYSEANFSISPAGCANPDFQITYSMSDEVLIINYPCIEPCQQKFIKVE